MAEVRSLMLDAMRRHGWGGAAVAVVQPDRPVQFECAGLASAADGRAVTPDTVFRIASISKTMTAIGLMQLRDRGLLDLDDPVNKHLATFTIEPPPGGVDVTFRHLLTHTSGIGELPTVRDLVRKEAWGMGKPGTGPADLSAIYGGALRPGTTAGAKWAYANHAFAVLGQLVQDISGEPFADHMRAHLFDPLGMRSTEYARTDRTASQLATGQHWVLGRFKPVRDYDLALYGPGSVLSSVTDMARYARWLAGPRRDADPVLRPETVAEMMAPQYSVHPGLAGMGLAFWRDRIGVHRTVGHDGNVPGFASSLRVAPDQGMGVVALTNTASLFGATLLAEAVLRQLLGEPTELEALDAMEVGDAPHHWSELTGYYGPEPGFLTNARAWQMLGGEAEIAVRNRRLVLRALSPLPKLRNGLVLRRIDDDELLYAAVIDDFTIHVAFGRNEAGVVDRLFIGPPSNVVLHRRSTLRSSRVRLRTAAIGGAALGVAGIRRRRSR